MIFKDLESLKNYLKQDAARVTLNPIRFINVDSMSMWIKVKTFLFSLADESVCLSKYCEGNDTTPNLNRVSSDLKKVDKSQFVTPLSEYLRIIPERAESIIQKLIKADYQNNDTGKLRIYFLMYRMKSLLKSISFDDPRTQDCLVIFETDEESDYKLTIVQKELDVTLPGNEIDGFKSYLEYWESNPDKPLILHTENAIHFEKNHFFDDVHVLVTSYDLLKYQFGLPSSVYEELGTENDWNELVKLVISEGSFNDAFCSVLSINKYSPSLFKKWSIYSSFQKWMLWLWARLQAGKNYEIETAKNCSSFALFIDELYCRIIKYLNQINFDVVYEERKNVLSSMQTVPTERFWNEVNSLKDANSILSCLTSLTDIERKAIFEIIAKVEFNNRNTVLPILKYVYPQLFYYLNNDIYPNVANQPLQHELYLEEYKWLKATNTVTKEFVDKVKQIASEKGASVFKLQSRNHYVSEHYDDQTAILFVDGMGIEYIDYLSYLFSNLNDQQYSVVFEAGYCTLPSVTEINKDFMDGRNVVEPPVRELDELKHANNTHPESLIKQLKILDELKNRVLGLLVGNTHRIIIASDHGTSRLAVKVRNTSLDNAIPKPDNIEIYKYGRFCEGTDDESKYPTAINYNDKLIFADYSRFIQSGAPIDEIHGGASLEEWIVPIITVERLNSNVSTIIVITPVKTKYKPEIGTRRVKVLFKISGPKRTTVTAKIKGHSFKCKWDNGKYSFEFIPMKDDTKLTVKLIDGEILGEFDIEIEQGIKKNEKFDI